MGRRFLTLLVTFALVFFDVSFAFASGSTWTEHTFTSPPQAWNAIASSDDGTKVVAVVAGGDIFTSTDSGATWTERKGAGARYWYSVTSSADGLKLAAAA